MALYKSRLLWKINVAFLAIILLSSLLAGVLSSDRVKRSTIEEVKNNLAVRSLLLAEISRLQIGNPESLQQTVQQLGENGHTRMTVILADGLVVADSEKNPATMNNHQDRPEIRDAALYAEGVALRFSDTLKTEMMYYARTIRGGGSIIGYARCSLPLDVVDRRVAEDRGTIILAMVLVVFLILLSGFFSTRYFIEPLISMTGMAEAMANGDFSRRLKLKRRDEIGRLAKSFNQMAENSSQRIATIDFDRKKLNAILSAMSEGVVAVDRKDRIIHINQAAAALLETDVFSCQGKPIWEVTRLQDLFNIIAEAGKNAGDVKKTMKISHGLRERIIEMHAAPLKDHRENQVGAMVVMLDVSELRHLETVRRDFVVNASHELKTPITAIRALTETMIDDFSGMNESTRLSFLNKISNQSLRLTAIIVDLMALSRFEAEEERVPRQALDLRRIIDDSALALIQAAETAEIELSTNKPETAV
ncbi:MAG: HAMP domain-containing protein, partial [Deltaproteobacteria bacterium]|nr:HAMP domain-containing protein [Deltaproteobacteria bacterium]